MRAVPLDQPIHRFALRIVQLKLRAEGRKIGPGRARSHPAPDTQHVNKPIYLEDIDPTPIISSFAPAWLSSISIKGTNKPYQNLPSVKHHLPAEPDAEINDPEIRAKLAAFVSRDDYPIPAVADREGYYKDRHFGWWMSGLRDYIAIKRILDRHGVALTTGDHAFELGCASGRVLRHFGCQETGLINWGCDIQLRHVEWIRNFLPQTIRVFQNSVLPQLPLASNSQKLIYAFSVFTHIDDFELAWLAELNRILARGGIAYLTVHSERTWQNMNPEWPLWKSLIRHREDIADYKISPELFQGPMPSSKTVFWWSTGQNYNTQVFHSDDYIRNAWGRFFSIKEVIPAGYDYQDVIVLQKD